MKRIIPILFVFLILSSCDTVDPLNSADSKITGEWKWIRTDGGIAFHIHDTPESTGKSILFNLTAGQTFSIIENNTEVSSGTYKLTFKNSIYSGEQEPFIELSENGQTPAVVLNGIVKIISVDTMTISDNAYDGIGSTFTKVN